MPTSALLPSFSDSRTPAKTLLTCLRFPYYLSLTYLLLRLLFYWRYFLSVEFSVSLILSLPVSILRFIQLMVLSSYLEYGVLWSVILMEEFSFYLLELFQNIPFSFSPYHDPFLPLCLWRLSVQVLCCLLCPLEFLGKILPFFFCTCYFFKASCFLSAPECHFACVPSCLS